MTGKCDKCKEKTRLNLVRGKNYCYDCERVTRPIGKVASLVAKPKKESTMLEKARARKIVT